MMSRTLKQYSILLLLIIVVFSCKKQKPDNPNPPVPDPPKETPSVYQSIYNSPIGSSCGTPLISNLKIQDGTDIGTVTVTNDAEYLYMTYTVTGNWYLGDVHSYAGKESLIPKNLEGNPDYKQFPGKQILKFCDLSQVFTFRVSLSKLTVDNSAQCTTNSQYYIAMRAFVTQLNSGADCNSGAEQPAWGAPFLINPGNANEWATAFYYCKQDCSVPPPPSFCAYSQGFWFNNTSQHSGWCQNIKFGSLEVNEQDGDALWPAQNNFVKRAFFQASALQLSKYCTNNSNPIPSSIAGDYNRLESFLSTLTYADLQNGTFPVTTDTTGVRAAAGNIGRWICNNHCSTNPDPTACSGF